jgi:predicted esterase
MKSHSLKVETTAHYYSLGELNSNTKDIWIVCHGYGQLATFFLRKFQSMEAPNRYIVAPEGFNKFYLKGFSGRVGASWMTKEKREDEIEDHCAYLEQLLDSIIEKSNANYSIKVLGFSQGTATVTRWLLRTKHKVDSLIVWGGKIANDFDFEQYNQKHSDTKNFVVFGTQDEFYTKENVDKYKEELNSFNAEWINYNGGHNIDSDTLALIERQLSNTLDR